MPQLGQETPHAPASGPASQTVPVPILAGAVLAWMGATICFLLLQWHSSLREFFCPSSGGCERVLTSNFSSFFGLPLPLFGVAYYLAVMGLFLAMCASRAKAVRIRLITSAHWITVGALTFSAGLMFLQFGVLHAFCPLCTLSAVITLGLVVATAKGASAAVTEDWPVSQAWVLTVALFACFPTVVMLAPSKATSAQTLLIDLSTAHLAGPRDARVKLVVFSDFECPFCRDLAPTLQRIHQQFPHDVLLAFRPFPLTMHLRAFPAAVAAECAGEQGAFWEYHDKLFAKGSDLSDAGLLTLAASLGIDTPRFTECLRSGKASDVVEASRRDAISSGLEGVPAVFLNGQRVEDGLDYQHLVKRIQELLQTDSKLPR